MSAVVSLLWEKDAHIIDVYRSRTASGVHTMQSLFALLPPERLQEIAADALQRTEKISVDVRAGHGDRAPVVLDGLAQRLAQSMTLVAALDEAHKRDGIELVVLNEDVTAHGKSAAAWAKARGVPSTVVSHSCILGRLYTVHREANTDCVTTFGTRGAQPYVDLGVPGERIAAAGNPAWDGYPQLVAQRPQVRESMRSRHGFASSDHVVVFATTWPAFYTAFCDAAHYERSLRETVRAIRSLRELGVPVQLVIKERPSNADKDALRQAILNEEAIGFTPVVTDKELEHWIVAADAVVSVDSNVSIEAMIAGTVAINVWSPVSWLNGPFFDAQDGIIEVPGEELAIALAHALGNENLRAATLARAAAGVPAFANGVGQSAANTAGVLAAMRKPVEGRAARYVWHELSQPKSVLEKGKESVYYRNARTDMLARVRRAPKLMLDVGCGAAATGAAVKAQYPGAMVVGIEMNGDAASMAEGRIDRVIVDNVETLDFEAAGLAESSIDLVFFPDVLEHLYDPWRLLARIKRFLTPDAQILASIPNARNLWLLTHAAGGDWQYAEEGLLDVTHIRFFTKKTIAEMFAQTGYTIHAMFSNPDGRVPAVEAPANGTVNLETPQAVFKNLTQQDLIELRTLQFVVDASPAATS